MSDSPLPPLPPGVTIFSDVDSTAFIEETLPGFLKATCSSLPPAEYQRRLDEMRAITEMGMNGEISFNESLKLRTNTFVDIGITRGQVDSYAQMLVDNPDSILTPSFAANRAWLQRHPQSFQYLTSGIIQMVEPALRHSLGAHEIHGNAYLFEGDDDPTRTPLASDRLLGCDESRELFYDGGKARVIRKLRETQDITLAVMLGDGVNDQQAKEPGAADLFVLFRENVKDRVLKADFTADTLVEAVQCISNATALLELDAA
jgi:phosphoserine phosphatase